MRRYSGSRYHVPPLASFSRMMPQKPRNQCSRPASIISWTISISERCVIGQGACNVRRISPRRSFKLLTVSLPYILSRLERQPLQRPLTRCPTKGFSHQATMAVYSYKKVEAADFTLLHRYSPENKNSEGGTLEVSVSSIFVSLW